MSTGRKTPFIHSFGPLVQAYNSTKNDATGFSPHYLLFGWHPRLSVDAFLGNNQEDDIYESPKDYIGKLKDRIGRLTRWHLRQPARTQPTTSLDTTKRSKRTGWRSAILCSLEKLIIPESRSWRIYGKQIPISLLMCQTQRSPYIEYERCWIKGQFEPCTEIYFYRSTQYLRLMKHLLMTGRDLLERGRPRKLLLSHSRRVVTTPIPTLNPVRDM